MSDTPSKAAMASAEELNETFNILTNSEKFIECEAAVDDDKIAAIIDAAYRSEPSPNAGEVERLRAALEEAQWGNQDEASGIGHCPECGESMYRGHNVSCDIGIALSPPKDTPHMAEQPDPTPEELNRWTELLRADGLPDSKVYGLLVGMDRLITAYRRVCAESEQLRRDRNALALAWDDLAMGTGKLADADYIRALYVRNSIVAGLPVLDPSKEGTNGTV